MTSALRRFALLVTPLVAAWCLALSGAVVGEGLLAVRFRDPWFPKTPAVQAPPGEAAPDLISLVSDAVSVLLGVAALALLVEVSKVAWSSSSPRNKKQWRFTFAGYLLLVAFQLLLVRDTARYWTYFWWSWLMWQLKLGSLPPEPMHGGRLVAFGPSGLALLLFAVLAVLAVARSERKPGTHVS